MAFIMEHIPDTKAAAKDEPNVELGLEMPSGGAVVRMANPGAKISRPGFTLVKLEIEKSSSWEPTEITSS